MKTFIELFLIFALWAAGSLLLVPHAPFTVVIVNGWLIWSLIQLFRGKL